MQLAKNNNCQRSLDDVIDDLGFGLAQMKWVALAGTGWTIIGALKLMHSLVSTSIGTEWNLYGYQRGALVSVCFAGQGVGSLLGGHLSDKFGRRVPCGVMYVFLFIFGVASTTASGFWSLMAWRLALGFTFGLGSAPLLALINETCPSDFRMLNGAVSACLFCAGAILSVGLVWMEDPSMESIDWRTLVMITVAPAVPFMVFSGIYLQESPHFLASSNRHTEASSVLNDMRMMNSAASVDVDSWNQQQNHEISPGPAMLFKGAYRFTFFAMCFTAVVINYSYYGAMYALPILLPSKHMTYSPAASMMIAQLCEPVGYGVGLVLARFTTRKEGLLIYLCGLAFCCGMFFFALSKVPDMGDGIGYLHALAVSKANFSMSGVNLFNQIGFLFIYTYMAEVFPTSVRATALGFCGGLGRLGSIGAPFMIELLVHHGGVSLHYVLVVLLCAINVVLVLKLPIETKNRQLGSIHGETEPLVK